MELKERIEWLRQVVQALESPTQREFLYQLLEVINDLIHKVEEFEPEQITEEDVMAISYPTTTSLLQQGIERDKLAEGLVKAIFEWRDAPNLSPAKMIMFAEQLKEKLNAPKQ